MRAVLITGGAGFFGGLLTECMTKKIQDPHHLNRVQYATADKLLARRNIYQYCTPALDIEGEIIQRIGLGGEEAVLDVGCGNGDMLRRLRQGPRHRGRLIGIDPSDGMIKAALAGVRSLAPADRIEFVVGRAEQLPFAAATFDVILGLFMLYHVPDISAALREWRRVLKPGGRVVAATSSATHLPKSVTFKRMIADLLHTQPPPLFSVSFNLENGERQLASMFSDTTTYRFASELRLDHAAPYLARLDSTRDMYEPIPGKRDWSRALGEVRRSIEAQIAERGVFTDSVCRGFFIART